MFVNIFAVDNIDALNSTDIAYFKYHEGTIIGFLQNLKLLPRSKVCSCGSTMKFSAGRNSSDGFSFRCCVRSCRKEVSLRKGTFFYQSQLSFFQVLRLLHLWSDSKTDQQYVMKECSIGSYTTVVDWKNFIRDICLGYFIVHPNKVGGPGIKVQIDESQICKRKFGVGRILQTQSLWIVGGVDEEGRVFMVETERRNASTLEHIITSYVERGSIIHSDGWRGYRSLSELGYEYVHETVIHEREFVSSTGVHTNRIEGLWSAFKRKYRSVTNKKKEMVSSYIAEWMFRRLHKGRVLSELIKSINHFYPV